MYVNCLIHVSSGSATRAPNNLSFGEHLFSITITITITTPVEQRLLLKSLRFLVHDKIDNYIAREPIITDYFFFLCKIQYLSKKFRDPRATT